jgi:hypothetical protein
MPLLYGPYAAWALDFAASDAAGLVDRSGNARHLANVQLAKAPDLREDAVVPLGPSKLTQGPLGSGTTWALNGELTVVCRAWFDGDVSRTQCFYQANFYPYAPSPVRNVPFTLATVSPDGALLFYQQHGANVADSWASTLVMPAGQWCWVSYRRALSGVVTLGINLTYQNSPVFSLPSSSDGVQLAVMNSNDGLTPLYWGGSMADMIVWSSRLSDAQLLPLYNAAMGVA